MGSATVGCDPLTLSPIWWPSAIQLSGVMPVRTEMMFPALSCRRRQGGCGRRARRNGVIRREPSSSGQVISATARQLTCRSPVLAQSGWRQP